MFLTSIVSAVNAGESAMTLAAGVRLGPYEILAPLGAGGMGEVYKARDTRLGRDVAVKVLPAHLSDSLDLKARFEREARAVAALSHPHICAIYDVGEATVIASEAKQSNPAGSDRHGPPGLAMTGSVQYLVMELLEGQSLAERLEKGPLPAEQVLKFGVEIADALDKAHRRGIIHRDLKPGNVMLTKSGVKLLDFGLAKTLSLNRTEGLSSLPTEAERPLTEKGTIMGTFQYMAPEQLEGKDADARTDIFSFGCVLHEMATGRKAFTGKSRASLIGAIMNTEPPAISSIQPMAPPALDHVVRRCLAKEPDDRWQSAADVASELKWVAEAGSQAGLPAPVVSRRKNRERRIWAVIAVISFAIPGFLFWRSSRREAALAGTSLHLQFSLPKNEVPNFGGIGVNNMAISPDGTKLVYAALSGAAQRLRLHAMDRDDSSEIPGTDGAYAPFFSPDGKWIGYFDPSGLKKVAVAGGSPILISDKAAFSNGVVWADDGSIFFCPQTGTPISRISSAGGPIQVVTRLQPGERQNRLPEVLPGSKTVLFTVGYGTEWDKAKIVAQRLDTGERTVLIDGGACPRYIPGGYLIYARGDSLQAVAFDPKSLRVTSAPVEVARSVWLDATGQSHFDFSRTGVLASVSPETAAAKLALAWIDREGRAEPLKVDTPENLQSGVLSPEGRRAALQVGNSIFVLDMDRLSIRKLTLSGRASNLIWSRDGRKLIFGMEKDLSFRVFSKAADDSGTEELLFPSDNVELPAGIFPDDARVLVSRWYPDGEGEIVVRSIGLRGQDKGGEVILPKSRFLGWANLSPNGRWLTYWSSESGRSEVFVRPVASGDRKWQVSVNGGFGAGFSRSGKELFYGTGAAIMAVPVETGDEFSAGTPKLLFDKVEIIPMDIHPDGTRFLGAVDPNHGTQAKIDITTGWFATIARKVREAKAP